METIIRVLVEASKVDKKKLLVYATAAYGVLSAARDLLGQVITVLQ